MCGIAGIWQPDGPPVGPATIARFGATLAHRGPDGEGVVLADDGRLGLAHRRLAILDRGPEAAQPMRSASGRFDITYNGEVYNFVELRAALESAGFRFLSDGDTEVVLAALEHWGMAALDRFEGMWALALWDRRERSLLLARDRFGVKPLYVAVGTRRIAFASELKAFLALDGFEPVADRATLAARLAGDFASGVLLRGVEMLPPGHVLEATPRGVRRVRWWHTLDHLRAVPSDPAAQADELRALLLDACRLRLRSDVPLATSLSGGLDSSSVLCAVAAVQREHASVRGAPGWRRAFIAGFPGTPQDETAHARLVAELAGVEAVVRTFAARDLRDDVEAYLDQFEEIGGLYGIAAWALYREMRRAGVVVSLDGHGGDELFGGYTTHLEAALLRGGGVLREPRRTLDLLRTLHFLQGGAGGVASRGLLLLAMSVPGLRALAPHVPVLGPRARRIEANVARHGAAHDGADPAEAAAIDALGPLGGALYRSFHHESLPRILRNFDAHAMGHGVEVRMPLLDRRLVCFAFSLPDSSKVSGGFTKRVLRESMRGLLPEQARLRCDKLGYNAPVARWLAAGLGPWLQEQVNDADFLKSELWDGPALRDRAAKVRAAGGAWSDADAHDLLLAATAHRWEKRWLAQRSPVARSARG